MNIFESYSKYYNLLYQDKEYSREVEYVSNLIKKYGPDSKTVLDLGCGTGRHDELFAKYGYSVCGIDISEKMLEEANKLAEKDKLSFFKGDIRNLKLDTQFDVVISLFHVISYQTTNEDLKNTFETASKHLKNGGLFIFDCWYGPAVLSEKPSVRVKRLEDENVKLLRIAEPVMYPNENLVDINYEILVEDKQSGNYEALNETHTMRYLFKPEIEIFMESTGFRLIMCEEWLSGNEPGFDTWGVTFLGLKK
ncbi:methyltransferase type 11 [Methanosarcina sp. 2.H.T.1A.6]|uniref:class I SAM-dependent DNA methyltransferase n=1 Tax=unclassified Methanosarcina TaxID=2644672 RepID=UPI0006227436|nr:MULTISPECIES: class I SAM-dependent methyltransferase [unclassified Methanosarcina]KKG09826.1 methyltransferase type 11 [Methanosarcina sp. 2.H.T.1A.15]KKG14916.1 methyltransferase type 11 [Methanosarcina sp. 2.H.T.1A.3]KKG21042.1 methyltransferase type 11 [Methanosarcina sp. 2.H.T.1A.6]KKG27291.1 methyltransferase type 11 [Methanosarcina sp. 2.H.T.1A.8]